jgi:hypothetical protein
MLHAQKEAVYKGDLLRQHTVPYVRIRQHTLAYVSIRQHTSAYFSLRRPAAATYRPTTGSAPSHPTHAFSTPTLSQTSSTTSHPPTHASPLLSRRLACVWVCVGVGIRLGGRCLRDLRQKRAKRHCCLLLNAIPLPCGIYNLV